MAKFEFMVTTPIFTIFSWNILYDDRISSGQFFFFLETIFEWATSRETWQNTRVYYGQRPSRCWPPHDHENERLRENPAYGIYNVAGLWGRKRAKFRPTTELILWYLGQSIFQLYKTYF